MTTALLVNPTVEYNGLTLSPRRYTRNAGNPATLTDDGIVDEVAVARAVAGHTTTLTPREFVCAVHDAATAGLNDYDIATRFGREGKSGADWICSVRNRAGIPAAAPHFREDELSRLIVDPSARARASQARLAAAGIVTPAAA